MSYINRSLTQEESKAILDLLRSLGEVSDKRIDELLSSAPLTETMEVAVNIVHTLTCKRRHAEPETGVVMPDEVKCLYYLEEGWEGKDHQTWLRETITLMRDLGIKSEDELMKFLNEATEVAGRVAMMAEQYPQSMKFIRRIIILPTPQ